MPQDRNSGAGGRNYGFRMARAVAHCMGLDLRRAGSNEVRWREGAAVIKSCGPGTPAFGVTASMLPRLDTILAAFEDDRGDVQVYELSTEKFRVAMYDSRSTGAVGGRVKMISKSSAMRDGRLIARLSQPELSAAADA